MGHALSGLLEYVLVDRDQGRIKEQCTTLLGDSHPLNNSYPELHEEYAKTDVQQNNSDFNSIQTASYQKK